MFELKRPDGGLTTRISLRSSCFYMNGITLSHTSSVGEWMYLTACLLRGPGHDSSVGGRINVSHCLSSPWPGFNSRPWQWISRDFLWLITDTCRGDRHCQVFTSSLKGYEEYEAIQLLLPSGTSDDQIEKYSYKWDYLDQYESAQCEDE